MIDVSNQQITRWTYSLFCLLFMAVLALALGNVTNALGETEHAAPVADAEAGSTSERKTKNKLAASLAQIDAYQQTLKTLREDRANSEGVLKDVMDARVLRTLNELVTVTHSTARTYLGEYSEVEGMEDDKAQIVAAVESLPPLIESEAARIQRSIKLPKSNHSALEQAALHAELRVQMAKIDNMVNALISTNEIARDLGMDTETAETTLKRQIARRTENTSAYLDLITETLAVLRDQHAALPTNEELAAKIAVTERHLLLSAEVLRQLSTTMKSLGIDATAADAQLISATGALTADVLDVGVISTLIGNATHSMSDWISHNWAQIMFRALFFVAIMFIAWKLAQVAELVTRKALQSARVRLSQLLQRMVISTARSVILLVGLLIGLSQLGFSLAPLLAGLGIAGFIIGFALQDSLSNFASGLMILVYRPFDVGDVVDVNGAFGTVRNMSLVNTTIVTYDNQTLVVPNNQVWQNVIKNLTAQRIRRVDMMFGIAYSDDVENAERVLHEIVAANDKVLKQPEPLIKLHELGESSVNFAVRPWVNTDDYWDTYWDITRAVKLRFDAEGISIPFPQRDVHLFTNSTAGEQGQT